MEHKTDKVCGYIRREELELDPLKSAFPYDAVVAATKVNKSVVYKVVSNMRKAAGIKPVGKGGRPKKKAKKPSKQMTLPFAEIRTALQKPSLAHQAPPRAAFDHITIDNSSTDLLSELEKRVIALALQFGKLHINTLLEITK